MKHWKLWTVLAVVVVIGGYYANFSFKNWINYKMNYQSMVRSEIHQMVKASCLQE